NLAYHVYAANGAVVVWDGARTGIGADLLPGQSRSVNVAYTAPTSIGTYALAVDTVREGVAWLSQLGSPAARTPLIVTSGFNGGYDQTTTPGVATIGASLMINVRVSNYGARAWPAAGPNPVHLSYHILTAGGGVVTWDGRRGFLAADLAVGQSAVVQVPLALPGSLGTYVIAWDLVQEGVAWFSSLGVPRLQETISVQPGVTFYGKGFGSANVTYQIATQSGVVKVYDQSANPPALKYSGAGPVTLVPTDANQPITVQEKGEFFHGKLQFKNDGGGNLRVVNFVNYDDYVKGVIPKEMPAGW